MRGAVDGLGSPFPLGEQLPSVYADGRIELVPSALVFSCEHGVKVVGG